MPEGWITPTLAERTDGSFVVDDPDPYPDPAVTAAIVEAVGDAKWCLQRPPGEEGIACFLTRGHPGPHWRCRAVDWAGRRPLRLAVASGREPVDPEDVEPDARWQNRATLSALERAQQALTRNAAYLALDPPATGQVVTQVEHLTRSVSWMVKLLLAERHPELLDDINDT